MKTPTFDQLEYLYREHSKGRGLTAKSVKRFVAELRRFLRNLEALGKKDIREIDTEFLQAYFLRENDGPYSKSTKTHHVSTARELFGMLYKRGMLLSNPMKSLDIKIPEGESERVAFTEEEVNRFLDAIEVKSLETLRDRAIFELMYLTGIRISEVTNLDLGDVDFTLREVLIRNGKGGKDRVVPLGKVSGEYLTQWVNKGRGTFVGERDREALFLYTNGRRISQNRIRYLFKRYLEKAKIKRENMTPHSLRHSCATHLLLHGADIRYVQELLGHAEIETTAAYTKGIAENLKKIQKRFHPLENELYEECT